MANPSNPSFIKVCVSRAPDLSWMKIWDTLQGKPPSVAEAAQSKSILYIYKVYICVYIYIYKVYCIYIKYTYVYIYIFIKYTAILCSSIKEEIQNRERKMTNYYLQPWYQQQQWELLLIPNILLLIFLLETDQSKSWRSCDEMNLM